VYRTRIGIAMRAVSQRPDVAGLMGISANRVIAFTFMVGAGLGAVAGVMVGSYYGIAHYQMGFLLGLKAFSAAVLGGIGNLGGAVLGGLLIGLIESFGAGYMGDLTNVCMLSKVIPGLTTMCEANSNASIFGSNYKDVYAFIVLILVLVFRPQGLLGERVADRA
jgi:branched-chain amino acid transport system permease protein